MREEEIKRRERQSEERETDDRGAPVISPNLDVKVASIHYDISTFIDSIFLFSVWKPICALTCAQPLTHPFSSNNGARIKKGKPVSPPDDKRRKAKTSAEKLEQPKCVPLYACQELQLRHLPTAQTVQTAKRCANRLFSGSAAEARSPPPPSSSAKWMETKVHMHARRQLLTSSRKSFIHHILGASNTSFAVRFARTPLRRTTGGRKRKTKAKANFVGMKFFTKNECLCLEKVCVCGRASARVRVRC